jgi:diadenosine tetraphosphate (Ap4A) HIT family hydrolase
MQDCEVCNHLQNDTNQVAKTDHWVIALAPDQGYLGRCYVTLRGHKGRLADLSENEWTDFGNVARRLEGSVTEAFGASPSNWACMMNNAYQEMPANPHVHWHFRPRYSKPYMLNDVTFDDPLYGHHYDRDQRKSVDSETFSLIRDRLKTAFESEK